MTEQRLSVMKLYRLLIVFLIVGLLGITGNVYAEEPVCEPSPTKIEYVDKNNDISNAPVIFNDNTFTVNFPSYCNPVDIYFAIATPAGKLIFANSSENLTEELLPYATASNNVITKTFSIADSSLASEITGDCILYWIITPANGGNIASSLIDKSYILGFYGFIVNSSSTCEPTPTKVELVDKNNDISNAPVIFNDNTFTVNFPSYCNPVDIYIAVANSTGKIIFVNSSEDLTEESLPYATASKNTITKSFSIAGSSLASEITGDCILYWIIAPANGGNILSIFNNNAYILGTYILLIEPPVKDDKICTWFKSDDVTTGPALRVYCFIPSEHNPVDVFIKKKYETTKYSGTEINTDVIRGEEIISTYNEDGEETLREKMAAFNSHDTSTNRQSNHLYYRTHIGSKIKEAYGYYELIDPEGSTMMCHKGDLTGDKDHPFIETPVRSMQECIEMYPELKNISKLLPTGSCHDWWDHEDPETGEWITCDE